MLLSYSLSRSVSTGKLQPQSTSDNSCAPSHLVLARGAGRTFLLFVLVKPGVALRMGQRKQHQGDCHQDSYAGHREQKGGLYVRGITPWGVEQPGPPCQCIIAACGSVSPDRTDPVLISTSAIYIGTIENLARFRQFLTPVLSRIENPFFEFF